MAHFIHQYLFYVHVFIGSIALVLFWIPVIGKKGDQRHRNFGKVFVICMYAVSLSGLIMSSLVLFDPITVRFPDGKFDLDNIENIIYRNRIFAGFLFMLSLLVLNNVRFSVAVLKAKAERHLLKKPLDLVLISLLAIAGVITAWIGFSEGIILLQVFAGLSIFNAVSTLHYIYKPQIKQREWIVEHLGNILGVGIGTYTAFFAFGGSRLFSEIFYGQMLIIPWILPSVIGVIAIIKMNKKYRAQYRIA